MADVEKNAYTMKTLNDAVMLRNRVIDMLEQAENETNPILRKSFLNFVVVGGGFAGENNIMIQYESYPSENYN